MADKEVRLIDANALKESLKKLKAKGYNQKYVQGLQDAIDGYFPQIIDDAPTADVQPKNGWISVKDRLPPYGERVLVVNEAYEAKHGYTRYNSGVTARDPHLDFTFWGHKVTHWQHLPERPKEDDAE